MSKSSALLLILGQQLCTVLVRYTESRFISPTGTSVFVCDCAFSRSILLPLVYRYFQMSIS